MKWSWCLVFLAIVVTLAVGMACSPWPDDVGWYYRNQQGKWTPLEKVSLESLAVPGLDLSEDSTELELAYVFLPRGAKRSEILEKKSSAQDAFKRYELVEVWLEIVVEKKPEEGYTYLYRPVRPYWRQNLEDQSKPLSRALLARVSGLKSGATYKLDEEKPENSRPIGLLDLLFQPPEKPSPETEVTLFQMPGELVLRGAREPSQPLPGLPQGLPGCYFLESPSSQWQRALENRKLMIDGYYELFGMGSVEDWMMNHVDGLWAIALVPDDEERPIMRFHQYLWQNLSLYRLELKESPLKGLPYVSSSPSLSLRQEKKSWVPLVDVSPQGLPVLVAELASPLQEGELVGFCTTEESIIFHRGRRGDISPSWKGSSRSTTKDSIPSRPPSDAPEPSSPDKWAQVDAYGLWGWRNSQLVQLLPPFGLGAGGVHYLDEVKEKITRSQLALYVRGDFPSNFELLHLTIRGEKVEESSVGYSKAKDGKVFLVEPYNPFVSGEYYKVTYSDGGRRMFIFRYSPLPR